MRCVDVLIAGGGPAGCAAALTLRRYTDRPVVVVERGCYEGVRVGETLGPGYDALLRYLGVADLVEAGETHFVGRGSCAAWGSDQIRLTHFLYTGRGTGLHLDRTRFERALAGRVEDAGAELLRECRPVAIRRDAEGGWGVELLRRGGRPGRRQRIRARYLVDATGSGALCRRRLGAIRDTHDTLMGLVGFGRSSRELAEQTGQTLVESQPDGWWYSAELPDGRIVLAYMTDVDQVRSRRLYESDRWLETLALTKTTRRRVVPGSITAPPVVRPAHSALLRPVADDGWIAVGDAALSFDPLSGMGIGSALASGMHAARALDAALDGRLELIGQYRRRVPATYERYLTLRRHYYALENRWPQNAFWARRQGQPRTGRLAGGGVART